MKKDITLKNLRLEKAYADNILKNEESMLNKILSLLFLDGEYFRALGLNLGSHNKYGEEFNYKNEYGNASFYEKGGLQNVGFQKTHSDKQSIFKDEFESMKMHKRPFQSKVYESQKSQSQNLTSFIGEKAQRKIIDEISLYKNIAKTYADLSFVGRNKNIAALKDINREERAFEGLSGNKIGNKAGDRFSPINNAYEDIGKDVFHPNYYSDYMYKFLGHEKESNAYGAFNSKINNIVGKEIGRRENMPAFKKNNESIDYMSLRERQTEDVFENKLAEKEEILKLMSENIEPMLLNILENEAFVEAENYYVF